MAIDKIQSESINLADNFAFTGTVTGAGGNMKPVFSVKLSSNQTMSDATFAKAAFASEQYDADGVFDATTNYRFTPTSSGKYFINVSARIFDANGRLYESVGELRKNGSTVADTQKDLRLSSGFGYSHNLRLTHIESMNGTGDYLEYFVYIDGGGSLRIDSNYSYFQAFKIIE
tara:strand:- start:27 stop:545 length:519 start_codon:yes stop_codon:yes gene_type:complete